MKGGVIPWLTCLMLISDLIFCEPSYIEFRSVSARNVRCNSRKLDRFGSLESIRLKYYRTLVSRKSLLENKFRSYVNATSPEIDVITIDTSNVKPFRSSGMYFNQGTENPGRIFHFRRGIRFIAENKRQLSSNIRYGMVNTQLSNTNAITDVNSKESSFLTSSSRNRIDGRFKRENGNRLSIRLRENRFKDELGLKESISSSQNYAERRTERAVKRDTSFLNRMRMRDESALRKMAAASRTELTPLREVNRRNSVRQRIEYFKEANLNNRRTSRNFRRSNLYESSRERESLNKLSNLKLEQNSLISRRELKIPEGERIGIENARRARSVRRISNRDQNMADNTLNRRNGRGFRGRMERRNIVEGRQGNLINQQIEFRKQVVQTKSNQKEIAAESMTRKSHTLLDTRREKFTTRKHFRNLGTDNFISFVNKEVSGILNDSMNRRYATRRIRETGQTRNRLGLTIPSGERRLTIRMRSSVTERIRSYREMSRSQERHEIARQAHISNLKQNDETSSSKISRNRNFQGNRVLIVNMRKSSMRVDQFSKPVTFMENLVQTLTISANDDITLQSSLMYGNRLSLREARQRQRRNSMSDERFRSQMYSVTRRLPAQSQVIAKSIGIDGSLKREVRNTNSRIKDLVRSDDRQLDLRFKEHANGRRNAVRRERESCEHKEVPLGNIRLRDIPINRNGLNLHRTTDLNRRRQIRNRIIKSRITKNIHEPKDSEQPKKQGDIEYSSALSFKSRRTDLSVRKNVNIKTRRVQTRISRMLVGNTLQLKAFEMNSSTTDELPGVNAGVRYDKSTEEVSKKMVTLTNSYRLRETRQGHMDAAQYGFVNFPISEPNTHVSQTWVEHVAQKQNSMFSFVTNILLGLAVIVAMSDDLNKGLVSRIKNQLRNCIFRFVTV